MEVTCTKKLLEKLAITAEVEECVSSSIETKGSKPRIFLDDNKLLKVEKMAFEKV